MLIDIHIKFKVSRRYLEQFSSYRVDMFCFFVFFFMTEKVPREIIQKVLMQKLWFLRSARRFMLIDIYMKFLEDIFNRF